MAVIPTRDGGTVEITRCGALVDIHVRDREGRTIATVTRRAGEGALLLAGYRGPGGTNRR
ncbi:hypothetical protein [Streptomyces sp. NPDC001205]